MNDGEKNRFLCASLIRELRKAGFTAATIADNIGVERKEILAIGKYAGVPTESITTGLRDLCQRVSI